MLDMRVCRTKKRKRDRDVPCPLLRSLSTPLASLLPSLNPLIPSLKLPRSTLPLSKPDPPFLTFLRMNVPGLGNLTVGAGWRYR